VAEENGDLGKHFESEKGSGEALQVLRPGFITFGLDGKREIE